MSLLADVPMLGRAVRDLGPFLRSPATPAAARAALTRRLAEREERFLRTMEAYVYAQPHSPYRRLLAAAGCDPGDLRALVRRVGLEGALTRLAADGVYLTFDEFKGRTDVVRGSRRFHFAPQEFDNPRTAHHFEAESGGTRGPGTAVKVNFPFLATLAANTALVFAVHGLEAHRHALWLDAGLTPTLMYAGLGRVPEAWFYAVEPLAPKARAGARLLAAVARVHGVRLPTPVFHDLLDPAGLARWLAAHCRGGTPYAVTTYASSAVRVAQAAQESGLSLAGVCFVTLGEPFTPAKQQIIAATGARALVRYAFTEGGIIGYGCAAPRESDDLHLFHDCHALVTRHRAVTGTPPLDSFLFTSLLPSTPKILLNVESGDYGHVSARPCACGLGAAGLTTHLTRIRSFEKLSTEGMTFAQTNLLRVLEEVLPSRFGGAPTDYQVLEAEEQGIARLFLLVSPRIGALSAAAVRDVFFESLRREGGAAQTSVDTWRRAGAVEVRREEPRRTRAGKILPLHLVTDGRS